MRPSHLTYLLAVVAFVVGCGGGTDEPQSQRNAYGYTVAQMQAAASTVSSPAGVATLDAAGFRQSLFQPGDFGNYDPVTGQFRPATGGIAYPVWFVAVVFRDAAGTAVKTDWTIRTVWVLRGEALVSSRDLHTRSDAVAFVATYPNPPFATDGTTAVVELVQGSTTALAAVPLRWQ